MILVGVIPGLLGIIFGILGLKSKYKGMAVAGIICGAIALLLVFFVLLFLMYGITMLGDFPDFPFSPESIPNYFESQPY